MLQIASFSLTPNYDDELWTLPAYDSMSVSPPPIQDAYNYYDAEHRLHQYEGK